MRGGVTTAHAYLLERGVAGSVSTWFIPTGELVPRVDLDFANIWDDRLVALNNINYNDSADWTMTSAIS